MYFHVTKIIEIKILLKNLKKIIIKYWICYKYNDHINYCKTRKPQRLLPANEKYITFNILQNCMLNDFSIYLILNV